MHISDLHDYNPEPAKVVEEFLSENRKQKIKNEIEELVRDEFDRLEDYANEFISDLAADRAERFLERVLKGDDDAAMALIGDSRGGSRHRTMGSDEGKPWASVIHGRLFETGGIELRRKIAEAHSELITNERIKDLESIVEGLKEQVADLEGRLDAWKHGL